MLNVPTLLLFQLIKRGLDIELCTKCAVHLLRCHQAQLLHTHNLSAEMLELKDILSVSINSYRSLVGVNISGVEADAGEREHYIAF